MVDEVLNVKGLADLNAALNDLAVALARNVLRGAVRAGAEVIRKEAVTRAPVYAPPGAPDQRVDPGLIKRSIFSAHVPNQSDDTKQVFIVGVRSGRRERHAKVRAHGGGSQVMNHDAYYAAWWSLGTGTCRQRLTTSSCGRAAIARAGRAEYLCRRSPSCARHLKRRSAKRSTRWSATSRSAWRKSAGTCNRPSRA